MLGWLLLIVVVGAMLYFRLAPTEPSKWHQPVEATQNEDREGGAIRVIKADAATLARIDEAARALPRTTPVAGSVDDGRITYMTRSFVFGFPDFTTVELRDGEIRMHARLRFGRSDFGVNRARLEKLVAAAQR